VDIILSDTVDDRTGFKDKPLTSLLNLFFNPGPTGGSETPATAGTQDSSGSAAFASSLAGLLDLASPLRTDADPDADPDAAHAEVSAEVFAEGSGLQVDASGNPLPAGGKGRQSLAAPGLEEDKLMDPDPGGLVEAATLSPRAAEDTSAGTVRERQAPTVSGARTQDDAGVAPGTSTEQGIGYARAVAGAESAVEFATLPAGAGGLLSAAASASSITVQSGPASSAGVPRLSNPTTDDVLRNAGTVNQRNLPGAVLRVEALSPRVQSEATGTGVITTPVAGAPAGVKTGVSTGPLELSSAALLAGMARPQLAGREAGRSNFGADMEVSSASTPGAARGNRSALSVYAATVATATETDQLGAAAEYSKRLSSMELRGLPAAQGSAPGLAPVGLETAVTEAVQLVRASVSLGESMAPSKSADPPVNTGLSLADGGEAAETLVQRMLQNQAQQLSSIRFQLRPVELGHLDVQMQWRGDQLQLAFTAQQAAARDLIESYLPQLRQLMQDMGLQLAGVDVRLDSDMKEGAQRQLQQQLGQNPNQNPGQGAGQHSDQQTSAQRDPQGQGHAGPSMPSAADGALETGNPEAGDSVSTEAGSRPRAVIDAFV